MIDQLKIRNFQRHDRLSLELDPRITAITGPSDAGKSSVLRAFRWLALNRPRGEGFVREGTPGAAVRLKVDGRRLERRKKGTDNSYTIDGKVLRSFGADVPEQVQDVLKLGEVNFSGQHDPPFWFSLTPGEVGRQLNEIVDLGEIDRVTAELASRSRRAKAEVEVVESRLEESEGELEGLAYVPELEEELKGLEAEREEAARRTALHAHLSERLAKAMEHRDRAESLRVAASGGLRAVSLGSAAVEAKGEADELESLLSEAVRLKDVASSEAPGLCGIDALLDRAKLRRREEEELSEMLDELIDQKGRTEKLYNGLVDARERLDEETGGICPVCGKELENG